jgi:hypothetical protein
MLVAVIAVLRSRGSVVGVAISYVLDGLGLEFRAGTEHFSEIVRTGSWSHTVSYSVVTGVISLG